MKNSLITGNSLRSVAHRFAQFNQFRRRFRSLKNEAYCRRHVSKKFNDNQIRYVALLDEYIAFMRCTYNEQDQEIKNCIEEFICQLSSLKTELEYVNKGQKFSVPSSEIRKVGKAATILRRKLRGIKNVKDCCDNWIKFGYVYHSLFDR